jgi:hypothetical protein
MCCLASYWPSLGDWQQLNPWKKFVLDAQGNKTWSVTSSHECVWCIDQDTKINWWHYGWRSNTCNSTKGSVTQDPKNTHMAWAGHSPCHLKIIWKLLTYMYQWVLRYWGELKLFFWQKCEMHFSLGSCEQPSSEWFCGCQVWKNCVRGPQMANIGSDGFLDAQSTVCWGHLQIPSLSSVLHERISGTGSQYMHGYGKPIDFISLWAVRRIPWCAVEGISKLPVFPVFCMKESLVLVANTCMGKVSPYTLLVAVTFRVVMLIIYSSNNYVVWNGHKTTKTASSSSPKNNFGSLCPCFH